MTEYEDMTPEERHAYRVKLRENKAKEADDKKDEQPRTVAHPQAHHKGILERFADKAESFRGKTDYTGNQLGRITKALTPAKKPGAKTSTPLLSKPKPRKRGKARGMVRFRQPVYQQQPRNDAFSDLISGRPTRPSYSNDGFNDLISGKRKKRGGGDFWGNMLG